MGSLTLLGAGKAPAIGGGGSLLDGSESDGTQALVASDDTAAEWAASGATITSNAAVASDGTTTASSVVENGLVGRHICYGSSTYLSGNHTFTLSAYLKANGRRYAELNINGGNALYDLVSGVAIEYALTGTQSAGVISIAAGVNGYYKCTFQCYDTASNSGGHEIHLSDRATIAGSQASGAASYQGDGTSGIYFWRPKVVVT